MNKEFEAILIELIDAAKPFTSGDIVDETTGTIPLMERLERAIDEAEEAYKKIFGKKFA